MTIQVDLTAVPRTHVVVALTQLRREWQEAAAGRSLTKVKGNVGLLLADVAMAMGLDTIEQVQVFGPELAHELQAVLSVSGKNGKK